MAHTEKTWVPASFFPVSPLILFPEALGTFAVYLHQNGDFVLYTKSGERFTDKLRNRIYDMGVSEVYVQTMDKGLFDDYVETHLGRILMDETIPLPERAKAFYSTSADVVKETFAERLPGDMPEDTFRRISNVVGQSMCFLRKGGTLKALAPFISHDYKTYTHCMHVFVYTVSILSTFEIDEDELQECGLGAMLHDVGKTKIPLKILNKRGALSEGERNVIQTHPVHGVGVCANLPISQRTSNCILFHHERMDGKGYPTNLTDDSIPLPVRAITVADVYDALTTNRPYAPAMRPFDALTIMRHDMAGAFDLDVFKRFIEILSGAKIV